MHAIEHFQARAGHGGRWLRARAKRLEDDHGRCIGAVQTIEDESTLRRMTEELVRLRERTEQVIAVRSAELTVRVRELDAFVTSAPIGVAFCAEGVIKRVNHALARMLGATEEALHGQPDALFRGDPAARGEEDPGGDDGCVIAPRGARCGCSSTSTRPARAPGGWCRTAPTTARPSASS
jgi:PAS domain-containing protein